MNPSGSDDVTFEKIQEMDAQFQQQSAAQTMDPISEAAALRACFQGPKEPIVRESCCSLFDEARWNQFKTEWEDWKNKGDETVGQLCYLPVWAIL